MPGKAHALHRVPEEYGVLGQTTSVGGSAYELLEEDRPSVLLPGAAQGDKWTGVGEYCFCLLHPQPDCASSLHLSVVLCLGA